MEPKKTPKADLENKRNVFVQLGLVISLGIVLMAFNLNDTVKSVDTLGDLNAGVIEDEVIPVTRQEEIKPPPPPPPPKVIEVLTIVDDEVELDEEFEFESTEANDATIIDAVPVIEEDAGDEAEQEVFVIVEDMPEFPGGDLALRKWIADHIKYPVIAAENGIQGKVYVQFVVDRDGSISNARVARGVDPSLDQEALRVVNNLPKWKPGMQRGKPVRVSFTVPINFQLQ
ncbi:MAG TPA: energy transducer TonB [Prolixibacteraceae bacterium]|nr:energy transducer TonB [Prolixibacteraceae bacterium]